MSRSIKKGPFAAPELLKRVEEMPVGIPHDAAQQAGDNRDNYGNNWIHDSLPFFLLPYTKSVPAHKKPYENNRFARLYAASTEGSRCRNI